jgi:hypothetical protein
VAEPDLPQVGQEADDEPVADVERPALLVELYDEPVRLQVGQIELLRPAALEMFEYELPMTDVIPTGIINHPF